MNRSRMLFLLFLCYAGLSLIRLTAPFDLDNRDQAKQGLYVLDVVERGSFLVPIERGNLPSSKPPFYTWVAAGFSLLAGEVTDLTIRLPAVLSGLGVVLLTFLIGETLFSKEVGLLAGLIVMINTHFTDLSTTARTDMMHCLFITFSLYALLKAYREERGRSFYSLLMFIGMGLGSITKSPVALLLPSLILLFFLWLNHDLKWLETIPLGLGMTICIGIVLGWFLPALKMGGQSYFDRIILDEMVNRFLGVGTRAEKIQPFYYLVVHFFLRFLPWSLFVPSALIRFWRLKEGDEKTNLSFIVVWFLTVLIFFSISRGKRADYLLPLYPAASILVGHLWFSLMREREPRSWSEHLRWIGFGYLGLSFLAAVSLLILFVNPHGMFLLGRFFPKWMNSLKLLWQSLSTSLNFFLWTNSLLMALALFGLVSSLRRKLASLLITLLITAGLGLTSYFELLSPRATRLSGEQKKTFCQKVIRRVDSPKNVQFCQVESSILFYLKRNIPLLDHKEALEFLRLGDHPYLVTTKEDFEAMRELGPPSVAVLEESDYLIRERTKYVLVTREAGSIR